MNKLTLAEYTAVFENLIPDIEDDMKLLSYERTALKVALDTLREKAEREDAENKPCADCSGIIYRQTNSGKIVPAAQRCAEKNNQFVVLPCKIGDKVYRICGVKGRKYVGERYCHGITILESDIIIHSTRMDSLGKTVFLTRAEAEAVLTVK